MEESSSFRAFIGGFLLEALFYTLDTCCEILARGASNPCENSAVENEFKIEFLNGANGIMETRY